MMKVRIPATHIQHFCPPGNLTFQTELDKLCVQITRAVYVLGKCTNKTRGQETEICHKIAQEKTRIYWLTQQEIISFRHGCIQGLKLCHLSQGSALLTYHMLYISFILKQALSI